MRYSNYCIYYRLLSIMPIDCRMKFRNTCSMVRVGKNPKNLRNM